MSVRVHPSIFRGPGGDGDFAWMLSQPEWQDALFVFNDNAQQSRAYLDWAEGGREGDPPPNACAAGGGNAVVRPYQCADPPRAIGVPTGPGFDRLDGTAKPAIDRAVAQVEALLDTGRYDVLVFSVEADDDELLGSGIFQVGEEVLRYVPAELRRIAAG